MPSSQQHLEQADSNEKLAQILCDGDGHYDWAVTVAFYSALHYFEAYLVRKGHNTVLESEKAETGAHKIRRKKAKQLLPDEQAAIYIKLQQQSESARYFPRETKNQLPDIPARAFTQGLARSLFAEMEQLRDYLAAQP